MREEILKLRFVVLLLGLSFGIQSPASAGEGWAIVHWFKAGGMRHEAPECFALVSQSFKITYPGERPRSYAVDGAKYQFIDHLHTNLRFLLDRIVSPNQRMFLGRVIVKATKSEVEAEASRNGYLEPHRLCPHGSEKIRVSMENFKFVPWGGGNPNAGAGYGSLTPRTMGISDATTIFRASSKP